MEDLKLTEKERMALIRPKIQFALEYLEELGLKDSHTYRQLEKAEEETHV